MIYLLLLCLLYPTLSLFSLEKTQGRLTEAIIPLMVLILGVFTYLQGEPIKMSLLDLKLGIGIGIELNPLSALLGATVLGIGLAARRYSLRHLADDPHQKRFLRQISTVITFVLLMLFAPNYAMMFLSWFGTSFFLHRLLTHFPERPWAAKAARQKLWVSRFGDLFLISTGFVLYSTFGTLDFDTIFAAVKVAEFRSIHQNMIAIAGFLLVLGALTKSAQVPFHQWLPNTMEAPTPVSALMHAGIINAGGYLVIRMSPLLEHVPSAMLALALIGSVTAVYGSLMMLAQSNIKKSLAFSTIGQMGFMMLQCGVGAFGLATVHMVGHAFYKAHSFLSAGSIVDYGRLLRYFPRQKIAENLWITSVLAIVCGTLVFATAVLSGYFLPRDNPGVAIILMVLSLASAQIILTQGMWLRGIGVIAAMFAIYLASSKLINEFVSFVVPQDIILFQSVSIPAVIFASILFIALFLVQNNLERFSKTNLGKWLYVRAINGG